MIKLADINKKFNDKLVLKNINIEFQSNSLTIITGESGCGKTTLFNIINGYIKSDSGSIDYDNHKILYNMVDDMNINILSVLDNLKLVNDDITKIDEILTELQIGYLKKKRVSKLSKGEQVRVSIARALLSDFDTILFDEPTGNLDEDTAKTVFELFKKYSQYKTIIVASHDKELSKNYADYLYLLSDCSLQLINDNKNKKIVANVCSNISKPNSKTLYKYAYKKAFRNPVLYVLALILMVLTSFITSYKQVDEEKTSTSIINALDEEFFTIYRDDTFKNYSTVKEYMDGKEIANKFHLYNDYLNLENYFKYNSTINAAFYEEFKEVYTLPKSIDDYTLTRENSDSSFTYYYPIIINTQVKQFFIDEYNVDYQVGQIFDYTLNTESYYHIKYEIVDILDIGYDYNSFTDLFPVIIPQSSYFELVRYVGISDRSIIDSLVSLHNEEVGLSIMSSNSNIWPMEVIDSDFITYDEVKEITEPGTYYYVGDLPKNDNEIMLSNFSIYYRLTGNDVLDKFDDDDWFSLYQITEKEYREKQTPFIEKYKETGYPVTILQDFTNSGEGYTENIKIVGYVGYKVVTENDDGTVNESYKDLIYDAIILTDDFYYKFENDILDNNRVAYNYNDSFYISKEEALKQYPNIINNTISIKESSISLAYKQLINMTGFRTIILYVGLVVFVLSAIVILIYFNNSYKTMKHDFAVFLSYGKTKKDLIKILILFTSIIILPTLIFIIGFIPALNVISQAQIHSYGISGAYMSFSYILPVISVFITVIVFLLISLLPLLKFRKQNLLGVIKNE